MDSYKTEDEQVEELKRWWRENGRSLLLGLGIALAGVFGWQYWEESRGEQNAAASATYQNLISAAAALERGADAEQVATARYLADTLKNDFSGTGYGLLAALYKASFAVAEGELDSAEEELRWVLAQDPEPAMRRQATLRLARVQLARGESEAALATLEGVEAGAWEPAFEALRGDIYMTAGDTEAAVGAWRRADEIASGLEYPVNDPLLQLKLRDSAAPGETVVEGES